MALRLAHLSDCHFRQHLSGSSGIAKRRCREVPELWRRHLPALLAARPDLLVVSGDLTDFPLESADDPAIRAAGAADLRRLLALFDELPCPKLIIPGNHDLSEQVAALAPPVPASLKGITVHAWPDEEGVAHVPTRPPARRAQWQAALRQPGPQVHVQHYLIWPIRNQGWPHSYDAAEEMRAELASADRDLLVLSGHYHPGHGPEQQGRVWYATVPAFCEAPHPVWIYEWDGTTLRHQALTLD